MIMAIIIMHHPAQQPLHLLATKTPILVSTVVIIIINELMVLYQRLVQNLQKITTETKIHRNTMRPLLRTDLIRIIRTITISSLLVQQRGQLFITLTTLITINRTQVASARVQR